MNSRIPYQTGARPHSLNVNSGKGLPATKPIVQFSISNDPSLTKGKE